MSDSNTMTPKYRPFATGPENSPADLPGFMECDTCRRKPGSPTLCAGCLHNRKHIKALETENAQLRESLDECAAVIGVTIDYDLIDSE